VAGGAAAAGSAAGSVDSLAGAAAGSSARPRGAGSTTSTTVTTTPAMRIAYRSRNSALKFEPWMAVWQRVQSRKLGCTWLLGVTVWHS